MGKIKKILENELVGGTQNTDVYPVTSVKAVYDEDNERLDNILNRRGVVNISTDYNADHIAEILTLEQAIAKVPSKDRVLGFQGKFLSENGWKSYVFIGDSIADWTNKTKWNNYLTGTDVVQESGESEDKVMSQKAVSDKLSDLHSSVNRYIARVNNQIASCSISSNDSKDLVVSFSRKMEFEVKLEIFIGKTLYNNVSVENEEHKQGNNWVYTVNDGKALVYDITNDKLSTVKYYDNSVDWGNYVLLVGNNYGNPFGNLYNSIIPNDMEVCKKDIDTNSLNIDVNNEEINTIKGDLSIFYKKNRTGMFESNVDINLADYIDVRQYNKVLIHSLQYSGEQTMIALYNSEKEELANITRDMCKKMKDGTYEYVLYLSKYTNPAYIRVVCYTPKEGYVDNINTFIAYFKNYQTVDLLANTYRCMATINKSAATIGITNDGLNLKFSFAKILSLPLDIQIYFGKSIYNVSVENEENKQGEYWVYTISPGQGLIYSIDDNKLIIDKYYDNSIDWTNHILLAGNNGGQAFGKLVESSNIGKTFKNAPKVGYEYFSYEVDTNIGDIEDKLKGDVLQDIPNYSTDHACVRFCANYSCFGKPAKLIIYNHGAGGRVTNTEAEITTLSCCNALIAAGYCLLEVNGYPDKFNNEKWNPNWASGINMGGPIYIRCVAKALAYVSQNYNIDCQNVAIIGRSMGGLATLNLCNSGIVNAKCLALDAPVIDLLNDAWNSGDWITGSINGGTRLIIAMLYGFDNCNFDEGTYSIDNGATFNHFSYKDTEQDINKLNTLYNNNINKVIGYNPFVTKRFSNSDKDCILLQPRLKIWMGESDPVNQIEIARNYISMCKNGGSRCQMRSIPTTQHVVWDKLRDDNDNDISVTYKELTISPYAIELIHFLEQEFPNF